jgi:hypothetical protein
MILKQINFFGSVAKNMAFLQNQKKPSQFGKLNIFIRAKITHKDENYSVKLRKYYFCNGTSLVLCFRKLVIPSHSSHVPTNMVHELI